MKGYPGSATVMWFLVMLAIGRVHASQFDVVINEVQYNPLTGQDDDEFVELYNRGGTAVDLSGWQFDEGIHIVFPEGTVLAPKAHLLVSPNAAQTKARYGVGAVGDYTGQLSNGGEVIALFNERGEVIDRFQFGDGGIWPSAPDGLGPTLERIDVFAPSDLFRTWGASKVLNGTPGAANSVGVNTSDSSDRVLISDGDVWRYLKGTDPYPENWTGLSFDDSDWESGPTGIGYGDDDDNTELADMEDGYLSFAARKVFTLKPEQLDELAEFTLSIDYDDAFVAYLNGQEVARNNIGTSGEPPPHDLGADANHEAGEEESYLLPKSLLQENGNVLAVQIHNSNIGSSDVSFIPRLTGRPAAPRLSGKASAPVVINEIKPSEAGSPGFIELYNTSSAAQDVSGFRIRDSIGRTFAVPNSTVLQRGNKVAFDDTQLGFPVQLSVLTYILLEPDGETFVDGLDPSPGKAGENGFSFGRYPDGDNDGFVMRSPSPGTSNSVDLPSAMVINEIYYHPPFVPPGGKCFEDCSDRDQWFELHNRSAAEIDLTGWGVTKGVNFDFPDGTTVATGGYVIVAADRAKFLNDHPDVDPTIVLGNWTRALSHDSDTINLRDELGNLVDRVKYGDGGPLNDEEPDDDIDDGTFRSSDWPIEAEATGRTIELVHTNLDNRQGGAWRAGPAGGTPGAQNAAFESTPAPVIDRVTHFPAIPDSSTDVTIRCRVSAGAAITDVQVLWRVDGTATSGNATLTSGGDGTYSGTIPAQAALSVIAYQVQATQKGGASTRVPQPPPVTPYDGFEGPYYLYQVIDALPPSNPSENYFIIMTQAEQTELETRDIHSNVGLYCTFIALEPDGDNSVHHLSLIRYRGSGTRNDEPRSYRVEFPAENRMQGLERINLNSQDIDTELLATDLFRRAGMPTPLEWTVNLTFQGNLVTRYICKERLDKDFLTRYFGGGSDNGNLYRAFDPTGSEPPFEGDLSYFGENPDDYRPYYVKRSNREADDYGDIIALCRAFDEDMTPDEEFADTIEQLIDVDQWARFFAVQACLTNQDGGIWSNSGEDYFLYHVPATSNRPDAGKFLLLPWDLEETFEDSDEQLFEPTIDSIRRFLTHQRFAPLYYCNIMNLRNGVFSRLESRQRFRLIDFLFGFRTIDGIDSYVTARIGFFDENIPTQLSSGVGATTGDPVISKGDLWRYFRGTEEPAGGGLGWTANDFDDSSWLEGPSGFGYGDSDDATELTDMEDLYSTLYIRRKFEVADPAALSSLELLVDFDDGFVGYLNGIEIARRRAPDTVAVGDPVPFDETAMGSREAGEFEAFDISAHLGDLVAGTNVLAIHGLNATISSSDFSLIPELRAGATLGGGIGCGNILFATRDVLGLSGRADACRTIRVTIDGDEANYNSFRAEWNGSVALEPGENLVTVRAYDATDQLLETYEITVHRTEGEFIVVSGDLAADTVWDAASGPYLLAADVTVPAENTLRIEPGALIYGLSTASIIVNGQLTAVGTEADPIRFRAADCANRWGGILLNQTGTGTADPTHHLRYCDVEFGATPPGGSGCLAPETAKVLVENCDFRFITTNAIDATNARVEVRDSMFEAIHEGVHCTSSTVIVSGCVFNGMIGDKDAIDFDQNGKERSLIAESLFMNGSDDGVDLGDTTVDVRDNVFFNIQDKALSFEGNGPLGPPTITGNILYNCGTAMALKNGVTIEEGHHNTIVGNTEGVTLFAKDGADDGGQGDLHSNIIWHNTVDVKLDNRSSVTITYSDISDSLWPGEGNLSMDPEFVNRASGDFSLQPTSPCVRAGKDGTDMGAVPSEFGVVTFLRGDTDESGGLDITDAIRTFNHLFVGGPAPDCRDRLDSNDDGTTDVSDGVYTLLFLFTGGLPPPPPYPNPGTDPTKDNIPCL